MCRTDYRRALARLYKYLSTIAAVVAATATAIDDAAAAAATTCYPSATERCQLHRHQCRYILHRWVGISHTAHHHRGHTHRFAHTTRLDWAVCATPNPAEHVFPLRHNAV